MPEDRIRVAPNTVAYADRESHKLVVEFAIPGAPTETIDVKITARHGWASSSRSCCRFQTVVTMIRSIAFPSSSAGCRTRI
jgi:hypothetical protein